MPSSCFFWLCILSDDRPTGSWNTASPRMPHTLGEIFTHAQLLDFKNRNSWAGPGAANVLVDQHAPSCAASWDLISAASAVANCGWNYCWWINWQRILESWSSSSSLLRGWSARMATRWWSHHPARGMSLHVSSSATLSKSLRTPAPVDLTIHTFRTVDGTAGPSFCRCRTVREEVRIWWTIARFAKPLFAHDVHAVAGALLKPNVACPHPDVSTWPVWWWCDRRWVRTPQMPPFVDQTDFFFICTLRLKRSCWFEVHWKPWR